MSAENRIKYQLNPEQKLHGELATYEIVEPMSTGAFGETYKAKAISIKSSLENNDICSDMVVVIKIPTLDISRPLSDKLKRLAFVYEKFLVEYTCMRRLRKLDCVARVLDYGTYQFQLGPEQEITTPALFIVQQFIDGQQLDLYLKSEFNTGCKFTGIPNASLFLEWARKLIHCLIEIHQRQIVHGDIWPENIIVQPDGKPVFIDFGQSLFRDLIIEGVGVVGGSHPYVAPEGSGSVGADIYSFGGVLYYVATGENPPPPTQDIDELKTKIADDIQRINNSLYKDNCGVVDIIARCLRYSRHGRVQHAEDVLQDIETFSTNDAPPSDVENLVPILSRLDRANNPLFCRMARFRIHLLQRILEDMTQGVYDLIGDHEDIVSGLTQYLSFLQKDDEYITVSLPSYWHTCNLGINGRFLAMNKLAAQRGATIRRIFLVTLEDKVDDPEIDKIMNSHLRAMREIGEMGIQTSDSGLEAGGYYTGFKIIDADDRVRIVREGKHFGLLVKDGQKILIAPIYREDGVIVSIQFRAHADLVSNLLQYFKALLNESKPLLEYAA
jgi:serine/threonine protein kinase